MADFSFGKSRRAFCVVTSITVCRDTPLILLMYSAETQMFLGSFLTWIHDTEQKGYTKSGWIKLRICNDKSIYEIAKIVFTGHCKYSPKNIKTSQSQLKLQLQTKKAFHCHWHLHSLGFSTPWFYSWGAKIKTIPASLDQEQVNQFLDRCSPTAAASQVSASCWKIHNETIINH